MLTHARRPTNYTVYICMGVLGHNAPTSVAGLELDLCEWESGVIVFLRSSGGLKYFMSFNKGGEFNKSNCQTQLVLLDFAWGDLHLMYI